MSINTIPDSPPIERDGPFINTVTEVVPSALDFANFGIEQDNFLIGKINEANISAGQNLLVVGQETREDIHRSRAFMTLFAASSSTDHFVSETLRAWSQASANVRQAMKEVKLAYSSPEIESTDEDALRIIEVQAVAFEKQDELVRAVQGEYKDAPEAGKNILIGSFSHPVVKATPEERLFRATISAFNFRVQASGEKHIDTITEGLEARKHDSGLFLYGVKTDHLRHRTAGIRSLAEFTLRVLDGLEEDLTEEEKERLLVIGIDSVSGSAAQNIDYLRQNALRQLADASSYVISKGAVPYDADSVDSAREVLALAFEHQQYEVCKHSIHPSEKEKIEARKRRIKTKSETFKKTGVIEQEKSEEPIERNVGVLRGTSDLELVLDDGLVDTQIDGYVNKYKHEDNLKVLITEVVDKLRSLDLSRGKVKGIKPLGLSFTVDDDTAKLYQAKPSEIDGINGGRQFKATRIIFTIQKDGSIGIVNICDRQDANTFDRNNGLGSKRKG